MIIKIVFNKPSKPISINNQNSVNSFFHRLMGRNDFHNKWSNYSLSGLINGVYCGNGEIHFPDENPYIQITSNDEQFIQSIILKLIGTNEKLDDMCVKDFTVSEFKVNKMFDNVFTLMPICIKNNTTNLEVTVRNDGWLELLTKHCKEKLAKNGLDDESFSIEILSPEKAKQKKIIVDGKNQWHLASQVKLRVFGKPETRSALYNFGIGSKTGCGFGCVKIL